MLPFPGVEQLFRCWFPWTSLGKSCGTLTLALTQVMKAEVITAMPKALSRYASTWILIMFDSYPATVLVEAEECRINAICFPIRSDFIDLSIFVEEKSFWGA